MKEKGTRNEEESTVTSEEEGTSNREESTVAFKEEGTRKEEFYPKPIEMLL